MSASLVGSEMCIRDSRTTLGSCGARSQTRPRRKWLTALEREVLERCCTCLLYTSDAADDM
eukprot:11854644-Alexandrium_andersonii.AAC.1